MGQFHRLHPLTENRLLLEVARRPIVGFQIGPANAPESIPRSTIRGYDVRHTRPERIQYPQFQPIF